MSYNNSKTRKVYLTSPNQPSGVAWLINCFLELGIKTSVNRAAIQSIWCEDSGKFILNPHQNSLKKWLPALNTHESFEFRNDIEIEWTHEWPTNKFNDHQIIYFIRDPRDALFSGYKRANSDLSFREFLEFLDPYTLLNKVDNWCLFNKCWLSHDQIKVFRFEDYKKDAHKLLESILQYINVDFSADLIDSAINASTFEMAAAAENRYQKENPEDNVIINRAGKVGSWKEIDDEKDAISLIENKSADLLAHFGYISENVKNKKEITDYRSNLKYLSFFKTINFDFESVDGINNNNPTESYLEVVSFAQSLDSDLINRARLMYYNVTTLIESLSEFLYNSQTDTDKRLILLYRQYGNKNDRLLNVFKLKRQYNYLRKSSIFPILRYVVNKFKSLVRL